MSADEEIMYGKGVVFTVNPREIVLVWPGPSPEMGPNDVTVQEHPELEWALAPDMHKPLTETDLQSVLSVLPGSSGPTGLIQPVVVNLIERVGDEWKICSSPKPKVGTRFIAIAGRTRTRWVREANRRIIASGGAEHDLIPARCERRFTSELGSMMVRDYENRCRKQNSPLDLARTARHHIEMGSPKHVAMRALGFTSYQHVLNYASLLELNPALQQLVDTGRIPISEALRIGREAPDQEKQAEVGEKLLAMVHEREAALGAAPEAQTVKLRAKDVAVARGSTTPTPMSVPMVNAWYRHLEKLARTDSSAVLVRAVLQTVIGIGDMRKFARFAPLNMKSARFGRKQSKRRAVQS